MVIQNAQELGDRKRLGRPPAQEQSVIDHNQAFDDSTGSVSRLITSCIFAAEISISIVNSLCIVYRMCDIPVQDTVQEVEQKPKTPLSLRSARRPLQVDLSKLEVSGIMLYLNDHKTAAR